MSLLVSISLSIITISFFTSYSQCIITIHIKSFGGGKEDRTPDPLLAKQVLSQLSYTPVKSGGSGKT